MSNSPLVSRYNAIAAEEWQHAVRFADWQERAFARALLPNADARLLAEACLWEANSLDALDNALWFDAAARNNARAR